LFSGKNIGTFLILSGFSFGFNFLIPLWNQQAAFAQIRSKNAGMIECSRIQGNSPTRKYKIQSATLKNARDGYRLILTVKGWNPQGLGSGNRVVYRVDPNLQIYGVSYHSDGQPDTKLELQRNGKFKYSGMPTSRSICITEGNLTFGEGVKQKLFSTTKVSNIKTGSKCATALRFVKNKITKGRRIKVVNISKYNISRNYQRYPKNRPFRYLFALRGAATESVLRSGQFLTSLSRNIIKNCKDISTVTFGLDETDYVRDFGLISKNKVGVFKCVDPTTYQKLPWGYAVCF